MTILDKLFRFPIILVNVENKGALDKEREINLGLSSSNEELDILRGFAEYPYYDFVGIEDRWMPNEKSLTDARDEEFDACAVKFANLPQLLVPWTKQRFKTELSEFIEYVRKRERDEQTSSQNLRVITQEQAKKIESILREDGKNSDNG